MAQRKRQSVEEGIKEMERLLAESRENKRQEAQHYIAAGKALLGEEGYGKWTAEIQKRQEDQDRLFAQWEKEAAGAQHERKLALERIGFERSDWDQLNWYVAFGNKDITGLSVGEKLNLNIELCAVLDKLHRSHDIREIDHVHKLQKEVRKHLEAMIYPGGTEYGPCEIRFQVALEQKHLKDRKGRLISVLIPYPDQMIDPPRGKEIPYAYDEQVLIVHLIKLLGKCGGMIRRCPHCNKIFLQFRRQAEFCSRSCQSIQFMQDKRRAEKEAKAAAETRRASKSRSKSKSGGA